MKNEPAHPPARKPHESPTPLVKGDCPQFPPEYDSPPKK